MRRLVIVGASLAGLRAAQAARKAGFDGELVMVGEERHQPYTRPPLSKELLAGEHTVDRVQLPCDELGIEWRLGTSAAGLDRGRRRVVLSDGGEVEYDRLILATGSRPRRWPGPGADLEGVHVLRDLDDALGLRAAFDRRPRVAIVGAGFIGCEVAQTARKEGLDVTLIDVAETPMLPL
jgi:NADPH-dependent 2,4-dienoyl-CoA reductase/sulfur reductase-like enzyme